jgi:hypothetical protein
MLTGSHPVYAFLDLGKTRLHVGPKLCPVPVFAKNWVPQISSSQIPMVTPAYKWLLLTGSDLRRALPKKHAYQVTNLDSVLQEMWLPSTVQQRQDNTCITQYWVLSQNLNTQKYHICVVSLSWDNTHVLGGIKYNQIHHYLIDWFWKNHHFLNILVFHSHPLGTLWWKKIFLDNWLVCNGGFVIFDTPYCFWKVRQVFCIISDDWSHQKGIWYTRYLAVLKKKQKQQRQFFFICKSKSETMDFLTNKRNTDMV